jgi:hypothetical protein
VREREGKNRQKNRYKSGAEFLARGKMKIRTKRRRQQEGDPAEYKTDNKKNKKNRETQANRRQTR